MGLSKENLDLSDVQQQVKAPSEKKPYSREYWQRFGLIGSSYLVLIAISSVFFRVAIYIPTPWITAVLYLYLAPIFLYSIGAMARPWMVLVVCFPGLVAGEVLWTIVYGSAGELLFNVAVALNTWGIGCLLISLLRKRNTGVAMFAGGAWSFFGVLVPTIIYYALVLSWSVLYMLAYSLLSMALNLVLIPAALVLNHVVLRRFKVNDFEDLILL